MYDMVSLDFGRNFGLALWNKGVCQRVLTLTVGNNIGIGMLRIYRTSREVLYTYRPDVVVEKPGRDWAIQWVQYTMVKELSEELGCKLYTYQTKSIKKQVSGKGNADKEDMLNAIDTLKKEYCVSAIDPSNEHEIDSIACGICHIMKTCGGI